MDTLLDRLIGTVVFGSAVVYPALQIYTGRNWRGGWRIVAFAPLLFMLVATAMAFAQESNLGPLVVIFAAPYGTAYLIILLVIHRLASVPPIVGR